MAIFFGALIPPPPPYGSGQVHGNRIIVELGSKVRGDLDPVVLCVSRSLPVIGTVELVDHPVEEQWLVLGMEKGIDHLLVPAQRAVAQPFLDEAIQLLLRIHPERGRRCVEAHR